MRRPIIGITLDHDDARTRAQLGYGYVECVARAGGVPIGLPFGEGVDADGQAALIDGLVLVGGNDIDPSRWGEARHPAAKAADPAREAHEARLLQAAERRGLPVLGVCFGLQFINVARGGSLHQHLPDVLGDDGQEHRRGDAGWTRRHDVAVEPASLLSRIVGGETLSVNTSHHQAINRVGRGLSVVARAPDGTVEAVEDTERPFWLAVQWHPERLGGEPRHLALFRGLIDACATADTDSFIR